MNVGEREDTQLKAAGGAVAAGVAAKGAPSRLLGYHKVYHGNPDRGSVKSIKKTGLKASKGGTGISVNDDMFSNVGTSNNVARSKNRVYFSKKRGYAQSYTGNIVNPAGNPTKVVKGRIPHNQYRKAKEDSLVRKLNENAGRKGKVDKYKSTAAMSNPGIPPSRIVGGTGDKGFKQFATKRNLKSYLKSGSGKSRFARGVGLAAGAAGAAAYSGKQIKKLVADSRANK